MYHSRKKGHFWMTWPFLPHHAALEAVPQRHQTTQQAKYRSSCAYWVVSLAKISTALPMQTICQLNASMNVTPVLPMSGPQKKHQLHHVNSEEQYIDWHRNRIIFPDYIPPHFQTHESPICQLELQCFTYWIFCEIGENQFECSYVGI